MTTILMAIMSVGRKVKKVTLFTFSLRNPASFLRQANEKSLLVFSATFHHVRLNLRVALLRSILPTCDIIFIAEPLQRTLTSLAFVFLSVIPALLVPIVRWRKPGVLPRVFWCWIIPLAPLFFLWDGLISALRQCTRVEWQRALFEELKFAPEQVKIRRTFLSTLVEIDHS